MALIINICYKYPPSTSEPSVPPYSQFLSPRSHMACLLQKNMSNLRTETLFLTFVFSLTYKITSA